MALCGGFGGAKVPTEEEQGMLMSIKSKVEEKIGKVYSGTFNMLAFKTQVVAGTNYMCKVQAGEDILHVKYHKPLPHRGGELVLMECGLSTTDAEL